MSSYRVISADNHVFEPPDLWTSRAEAKFKERAPRVESLEAGDFWFCDGNRVLGVEGNAREAPRSEEVRLGGYIPEEHAKDMDMDGVDVNLVYPTIGLFLYSGPDSDLLTSNIRSYNDWVGEFCNAIPSRLKGVAMLNIDDVGEGVHELERCAKMGFVGALITVYPVEGRSYDKPEYEPLWDAAESLGIPLSMHIGTNRAGPGQQWMDLDSTRPSFACNGDHWVRISLADMILSGVFVRHPKLQIGSIEHELSWAPHFLNRIDFNYGENPEMYAGGFRFKDGAVPSDFFHSNVFLGFQEDAKGIKDRHVIGVDQLQWGSDYPHSAGTFPNSREVLEDILSDCTEEEKAKIVGGNAARVYRLD
jgi:predicted TIM-barrel fold metal-dependent hydrolase